MTNYSVLRVLGCLAACLSLTACEQKSDPAAGAPPLAQSTTAGDVSMVTVDKPDQFPLVQAERIEVPTTLDVTGSVNPDIAREVPVVSLASGRIVDIKARLDDKVKKGQLLLKVQSPDITNAFDAYLKAANDEQLANKAYVRAKDLYSHGAISLGMLEQAEDSEKDAKADLVAAEGQIDTLGVDKDHPSNVVNIYAPISGVIIAQNVTNAAATGVTFAGSSTAFTIADLSVVWILCDVYENDIPKIQLGQSVQIKLNAYPGESLTGRISDIGPTLDPSIRTAKVRVEVANPGILRLGMFVTATFQSKKKGVHAAVPASSVMHLHDRDWVFVPAGANSFRRVEVKAGDMLPGDKQDIVSGLNVGQQVVSNVLPLEATVEAQ
jgi:cobalt-zinc-cadmium efflux system membrane fusion protein